MVFKASMKMATVIHENYLLVHVLNRFGIKLGFGDSTIEEICKEKGIQPFFFLEIINTFNDEDYFPNEKLKTFSVEEIVAYLEKTHKHYLEKLLPQIDAHINNVVEHNRHQDYFALVRNFFAEYASELKDHTDYEDHTVFPYCRVVEDVAGGQQPVEDHQELLHAYHIDIFERQHDNLEEKLLDLKNLIIKYLPEPLENQVYNMILFELFNLEKDLNNHARIEDKVLVPKIKEMEQQLAQRYPALYSNNY